MIKSLRSTVLGVFGSALGVAAAVLILVVAAPTMAAAGPSCNFASHWFAQAQSGCCSWGTGIQTVTPAHWSVNRASNSTTDEAAWLIAPNQSISIEDGYYSGYFHYNNSWTNSLVSYMTLNNGTCCGATGGAIAPSSSLWIDNYAVAYIGNCGPDGADVGGNHFRFCYSITTGTNFAQGEVTISTATWMGGGSGEGFTGYYSNDHTHYYLWGSINGCYNSPYWLTVPTGHSYSNGGY